MIGGRVSVNTMHSIFFGFFFVISSPYIWFHVVVTRVFSVLRFQTLLFFFPSAEQVATGGEVRWSHGIEFVGRPLCSRRCTWCTTILSPGQRVGVSAVTWKVSKQPLVMWQLRGRFEYIWMLWQHGKYLMTRTDRLFQHLPAFHDIDSRWCKL